MKIELKNIKINNAFSEETICFTATIYVDGKLAGYAKNRGHGGCTDCDFISNEIRGRVESYVSSLPPTEWTIGGEKFSHVITADSLIDDMVNDHSNAKEDKKLDKQAQKTKQKYAAAGYNFTLELRQPHRVLWCPVKNEKDIEAAKEKLAKANNALASDVKLI